MKLSREQARALAAVFPIHQIKEYISDHSFEYEAWKKDNTVNIQQHKVSPPKLEANQKGVN